MSTSPLRQYRFATAAQWRQGLRHRFDIADGELRSTPMFHLVASLFDAAPAQRVAAAPDDFVFWRVSAAADAEQPERTLMKRVAGDERLESLELVGVLRTSPRWVVDHDSVWAFEPGGSTLVRLSRGSLSANLEIDVAQACAAALDDEPARVELLDVASDTHCGVWTLSRIHARTGGEPRELLLHFDARGCGGRRYWVPAALRAATELAVTHRGETLVVLGDGTMLQFMDASDGRFRRRVALSGFGCEWAATRLTSDGRNRIALAGGLCGKADQVCVFDGDGDVLQDPIAAGDRVCDLATCHERIWLATPGGLRLLRSGAGDGAAREAESFFMTPLLESPVTSEGRGWLRAEVLLDLPAEGSVEAEFAGTNDAELARRVRSIMGNGTSTAAARRADVWNQFEPTAIHRYVFTGAQSGGIPVAIPIFETDARWLMLVVRVVSPPNVAAPVMHSLNVRYPERSIAEHLPAIYRNRNEDPAGFFRRLLGVLESTTQRIDGRIGEIARALDPRFAPEPMLNYLAGWLGIPWDAGLDEAVRRELLANAEGLTRERGTRAGLRRLLRALLGANARIRISDSTVDHGVSRLGGGACRGAPLPLLLAGQKRGTATLGEKAVLGVMRLPCAGTQADALNPLRIIVPTLRIDITALHTLRARFRPLLENLLRQYLPASVDIVVRWHAGAVASNGDEWALVLDEPAPARMGADRRIGYTRLGGTNDIVLQ